jgi:hypothetical protein
MVVELSRVEVGESRRVMMFGEAQAHTGHRVSRSPTLGRAVRYANTRTTRTNTVADVVTMRQLLRLARNNEMRTLSCQE